jgi:hypothetical protein
VNHETNYANIMMLQLTMEWDGLHSNKWLVMKMRGAARTNSMVEGPCSLSGITGGMSEIIVMGLVLPVAVVL